MQVLKKQTIVLFVIAFIASMFLLPATTIQAKPEPPQAIAGFINAPENYQATLIDRQTLLTPQSASATALKAVVIVGDVESNTASYKSDMDTAVAALESHGVSVTKFYYGDTAFGWSDIVNAVNGTHFLLYMGHGISWNSTNPVTVGGFYLGNNQFISADQIRNDLAGRLADDSVMILSHVCYSAGSSAGDPAGLDQAEAERRVAMYAEPFIDLGMEAYYANNYYDAAERIVNKLLADIGSRQNAGDIFKSIHPYNAANFKDLSYPTSGYDLWLSGEPGNWDDSFVGIPAYTFIGDDPPTPKLGDLPDSTSFSYSIPESRLLSNSYTVTPFNSETSAALTWEVTSEGDWFSVSPTSGTTPASFQITPNGFNTSAAATHSGIITVTVSAPADTGNAPQQIALTLNVIDQGFWQQYLPCIVRD